MVVVGNGNVALDVARILTTDPDDLATTDIAALPWATLSRSRVREVVVLGRRGPADAAFTVPELVGLAAIEDLNIEVDTGGEPIPGDTAKLRLLAELATRPRVEGLRTLVLRFRTTPDRILGTEQVTGVQVARDGASEVIECGLLLRAIGYHGEPVSDLPYDPAAGTVPNDRGRVRPGVYVAGWVKRGPNGFIGTNKSCAQETVERLLDDIDAGALPAPTRTRDDLASHSGVARRDPDRRRPAGGRSTARSAAAGCSADGRGSSWWTPRSCAGWRAMGALAPVTVLHADEGRSGVEMSSTERGRPDGRQLRWDRHNQARRQHILDAAIAVLEDAEPGEDIHVQQIAERAGLSRTVVYRHFSDRADLDAGRAGPRSLEMLPASWCPSVTLEGTIESRSSAGSSAPTSRWAVAHPSLHGSPSTTRPGPGIQRRWRTRDRADRRSGRGADQRRRRAARTWTGSPRTTWPRSTRWSSAWSARCSPRPAAGWRRTERRPDRETFVEAGERGGLAHIDGHGARLGGRARPATYSVESLLEAAFDGTAG